MREYVSNKLRDPDIRQDDKLKSEFLMIKVDLRGFILKLQGTKNPVVRGYSLFRFVSEQSANTTDFQLMFKTIITQKSIVFIILLGLVLRLINLNQSLWLDEAINALAVKNNSFVEIIIPKILLGSIIELDIEDICTTAKGSSWLILPSIAFCSREG